MRPSSMSCTNLSTSSSRGTSKLQMTSPDGQHKVPVNRLPTDWPCVEARAWARDGLAPPIASREDWVLVGRAGGAFAFGDVVDSREDEAIVAGMACANWGSHSWGGNDDDHDEDDDDDDDDDKMVTDDDGVAMLLPCPCYDFAPRCG